MPQFLWIIRTDPDLDLTVRNEMVDLLKDHDNFFLVASNHNAFPITYRNENIAHEQILNLTVYTGNRQLLTAAMNAANDYPLFETRLDADDGLHVGFLHEVQTRTLREFNSTKNLHWLYYCSKKHMEWHWVDKLPRNYKGKNAELIRYGGFKPHERGIYCITPGMTYGLAVGASQDQPLPIGSHHMLARKVNQLKERHEGCGYIHPWRCLIFMSNEYDAIRSRTPTSAGMSGVSFHRDEAIDSLRHGNTYLAAMESAFHIEREALASMNDYVSSHLKEMAEENLLGQCTRGHSCKKGSKEMLESIIQKGNM